MRPKRIFVVGSLNIDLVTRVERLPREGETLAGSDLIILPGGKGANQVCAAARLGGDAVMIGQIGSDAFGEPLLASLRAAGVDIAGVSISPGATGVACISVLPGGENAIMISPGANARLTPQAALHHLAGLQAGDLVLLQLEIPLPVVEAVLEYAFGRGAVTFLDPAPAQPLPPGLLRNVHYLTPNQSEAALLLNESESSSPDFAAAGEIASRLLDLGPKAVILKLGPSGCFVAGDGFRHGISGFTVDAVDTTAAGDTFNAGFAVGLAEGMPIPAAAQFANAAAAISVTRLGAQSSIPNREEVNAFLQPSPRPMEETKTACS